MKTIFKTAMLIAIMVSFSCSNESLNDSLDSANKSANAERVTKKITNSLASDPDPNATNECGEALYYGIMSHMGKVTGYTYDSTCYFTEYGTLISTGSEVTIAANGDEMWSIGTIEITFPTDGSNIATIEGGSIITGGTGRFAGATGWFVFENMTVDLLTGHESHTAYGEITY
ncbi:hypothetical protein RXV94_10450 [Yeosuana sp. MJ-SS3]|uniref:Allene oxide cyclase n=1 Tax=Gilvirhabdus luticola TaxID=3079858 RepID=A0ABU3U860_9FLAO|nr:hypothetical protein [Yeosuana sp. MJ-SS3]MDU8886580.1 hypothetical protein [Yeosuana sp. MJ-SS3]